MARPHKGEEKARRRDERLTDAIRQELDRREKSARRAALQFAFVGAVIGVVLTGFAQGGGSAAYLTAMEPCLNVTSYHVGLRTYEHPPSDSDALQTGDVDLPNGSQYVYHVVITNGGDRAAVDVAIRMNLPGVPIVTSSSLPQAAIDVSPVNLTVLDFKEKDVYHQVLDPRLLTAPTLQGTVIIPLDSSNGSSPLLLQWAGARAELPVVGAQGTQTVEYVIPRLSSGDTWQAITIYFGKRTGMESAVHLSAAAATWSGDPHYERRVLTEFTDTSDVAHPPVHICDWPTFG